MLQYVIAYIVTAVIFFAIDFVWLGKVATNFYSSNIGHLMLDKPNFVAAGGFYALYIVGILVFAVVPALRSGTISTALIYGALFGFFAYATYDMTNYATLRGWPVVVVVVDVIWGTMLTCVAAGLGTIVTRVVTSH
ncbi:DUF2177 family protein [Roseibium sp.]|uniref:DUF2177 family protein n=1 Tax=Roseibium sp. TaxID=1936156 RepID=UPI003A97B45A